MLSGASKVKILALLTKETELNVTAIAKKARINHSRLKIYLEELKDQNIVTEKNFGKIRIFLINENNEGGKLIKELFSKWEKSYEINTFFENE